VTVGKTGQVLIEENGTPGEALGKCGQRVYMVPLLSSLSLPGDGTCLPSTSHCLV
jgi:hypothetical protein